MRHRTELAIGIRLDRRARQPLREQLADQLCAAIDAGTLGHDSRLPSTRALGARLGVSRGVPIAAYDLLFSRGYLAGRPGSGTYVTARPAPAAGAGPSLPATLPRTASTQQLDLTPGQACPEAFPLAAWRAAWRSASYRTPPPGPLPPLGLPHTRHALSVHLARTGRPVPAGYEVVVTAGTMHALRLVLGALGGERGAVAVEDPAPPALRAAVAAVAGDVLPLPVDDQGARIDTVGTACRALVLSADAHVPLGHVLSAQRAAAVDAWAGRTGAHVIAIATDLVPRFDAAAPPQAAGTAPHVFVGGFDTLLTPALQLGYAVVPRELLSELAPQLVDGPECPSYLAQTAMAQLLLDGTVVRRMNRLGRILARKRQLVRVTLGSLCPAMELFGLDAPGTVGIRLPPGRHAVDAVVELARHGLLVHPLASYHNAPREAAEALVLGYSQLDDPALCQAMTRLVGVLARS